jgi:hypothetical protein
MMNCIAALILASRADGHTLGPQDNDTVVTPTCRAKTSTSNDQFEDKTLRFGFPVMDDGNHAIPPVLHYHLIAVIQEGFGNQIKFLDNENRRVDKIDVIRFDINAQTNSFTWYNSLFIQAT